MRPALLVALAFAASGWGRPAATDLAAVADALGGRERFGAIETLRLVADVAAEGPAGEVAVRATTHLRVAEAVRIDQRLPAGRVSVIMTDTSATAVVGGSARPIPEADVDHLRTQLALVLPVLLARHAEVERVGLAWEGDDTVLTLRVPGVPEPVRLVVGPDGRPASASTTVAVDGGLAEVAVAYGRYRRTAGLLLPFSTVQTVDGVVTGTRTLAAVEVNPPLPDGLFSP